MHKQRLKTLLLTLASVFCLLAAGSVRAMHGVDDPFSLSGDLGSGDLGGGVGSHFRRTSPHDPVRELSPEPSEGDSDYGSHSGGVSPRSESPTSYNSYNLKHRAYSPAQRLSFESVQGQDLGGGHLELVQGTEQRPVLSTGERDAILHIAKEHAPRILFDKGGNVLARDDVKTPLTPEQKAFYRTIITKMQEQRAQYSSRQLTSDQRAVERYCIEAINDGLVELHALETSGVEPEKITEMQKNIETMIGQMDEVIGVLPTQEEHALAAVLSGDISLQRSAPDVFADVDEAVAAAAQAAAEVTHSSAGHEGQEPLSGGADELPKENEELTANDQKINTFLKELGWNRSDLESVKGKRITKDLRTALRQISDIEALAASARQSLGTEQIDSIKVWQGKALAELEIFVAKQRIRKAVGDAADEIGQLEDLMAQVQSTLKGKDQVLAEFKRTTSYYLGAIKKAQKNLASQSTYFTDFTDFTVFEKEFGAKDKVLKDAIEKLRTYLNSIEVVKPRVKPIEPVVEVPQKSQPVRLASPVLHEEEPIPAEGQNVEQFLTSGTGAKLLDAQIGVVGLSGVTVEASRSAAIAFLQDDSEFTQLVRSLQKLEAQKGTKSRTLGDLFGDGDKQSQKLNKQIAQQKAAVEKRIAAVLKQVQKVQALLAKTPSGKGYGAVSLELGEELHGWKARLLLSRRDELTLALRLVTILEEQAQSAAQDTALKNLAAWEAEAQEAKPFFEQTNLETRTVQELRADGELVQKQLQKVEQLRNVLPSSGEAFGRRQALTTQLEIFQKAVQDELARREKIVSGQLNQVEETLRSAERIAQFSDTLRSDQLFPNALVRGFNEEIGVSLERLITLTIPGEYPQLEAQRKALIAQLQEEQAYYLRQLNAHPSSATVVAGGEEHGDTVLPMLQSGHEEEGRTNVRALPRYDEDDEDDDVLYRDSDLSSYAAVIERNSGKIGELFEQIGFSIGDCLDEEGHAVLYDKLPAPIREKIGESEYAQLEFGLKKLLSAGTDEMFVLRQESLISTLKKILLERTGSSEA